MAGRRRPPGHRWIVAIAGGLAAAHASAAPARGQDAASCPQGRITDLVIDNRSVFDLSDDAVAGSRIAWAYRLANALHVPTRQEMIERELLFEVGDCLDAEELADSERLLRGFGFVADATITAVPTGSTAVRVTVETQDEWSTRLQPEVESDRRIELQGFELAEDNLLGYGRHISLFFDEEEDQRVYGMGYSTPQFFRTRTDMSLRLARTEVGGIVEQSIVYPFVGERGRYAFRQAIERRDLYFEILKPRPEEGLERLWVPVRRERVEVGAAVRRGRERYRHTVFGAAIAGERVAYRGPPVFADSAGRPPVPAWVFEAPWAPLSSVRAVGLVGRRDVRFVRRRGLDTVDGTEDVQLGYEGEVSFGATLPGLSDDEDVMAGVRLGWAGEPGPRLTWGMQIAAGGRRTLGSYPDGGRARDVVGEADGWAYFRPRPEGRRTIVGSISAVAASDSRVPLQLSVGGDTGLRGYPRHLDPGGRRVAASLEIREYLGWPLPALFDLGAVGFVDAAKLWPGDVPFGREAPLRATIGAGLRLAFPAGSRQTLRFDVGLPVRGSVGFEGVVFSVGMGQVIGRRVRRPDAQLERSATFDLSSSDFLHTY